MSTVLPWKKNHCQIKSLTSRTAWITPLKWGSAQVAVIQRSSSREIGSNHFTEKRISLRRLKSESLKKGQNEQEWSAQNTVTDKKRSDQITIENWDQLKERYQLKSLSLKRGWTHSSHHCQIFFCINHCYLKKGISSNQCHWQSYTEEGPDRPPPLIYHEFFREVQHGS